MSMINYRQWKKNYKKHHGHNPYWRDDRRKRIKVETIVRNIRTEFASAVATQTLLSAKHLIEC